MPKQPKNSPLTIINHEFTVIELSASSSSNPTGELELNTDVNVGIHSEDPLLRSCELSVAFGSAAKDRPAPYTGKITINGQFQIAENYAEHRRQQLIEVTAISILYGACREMLANLTARSSHGLLSLPSVSFFDPNSSTAKKVAKKTVKKVAKKTVKKAAHKKPPKS
jgi:preprotein translocase subunit SecB